MVTLRHAFDANSMKGLVLKILRGTYPAIPSTYSQDLKDLIADMLIKDPAKRPSMRKILEKEFLSRRISKLLTTTIAKKEFSSTFVSKHLEPQNNQSTTSVTSSGAAGMTSDAEESKDQVAVVTDNDSQSQVTVQSISKQKIVIKQEAAKVKKKRIEVIQGVNVGGSSAGVAAGGTGTEEDQERAEMVSNRAADKENNKPYNVQISSNVE